jgi:rubrerythrin
MMYTTEQLHAAIEQEVRPFMEERDHYFERCAQLEAALLRVQHGLEDRAWIETRSEMIDFIINTVHESRSQSETVAELSETKDKFCRYLLIGGANELCPVCGEGPCQTPENRGGKP